MKLFMWIILLGAVAIVLWACSPTTQGSVPFQPEVQQWIYESNVYRICDKQYPVCCYTTSHVGEFSCVRVDNEGQRNQSTDRAGVGGETQKGLLVGGWIAK